MEEERQKSRAHAFSLPSSTPTSIKMGEGGIPTEVREWMSDGMFSACCNVFIVFFIAHTLIFLNGTGIEPEFTGYDKQTENEAAILALLPDIQVNIFVQTLQYFPVIAHYLF